MLIEYSVENFRSISQKVTLCMIPTKGTSKAYNLIKIEKNSNIKKLLRSCVIYGANGSGKTNIILALNYMTSLVLNSKNQNKGQSFSEYQPFLLNKKYLNMPTRFEISFIKENVIYKYAFSFNKTQVITEDLSYLKGKNEIFIFKRNKDKLKSFTDDEELKKLFEHTGENVLFLSKANNEYKKFGPIYEWFDKNLEAIGPLSQLSVSSTIQYMNESEDNKKKLLEFLQRADFDIYNIDGKSKTIKDPNLVPALKNFLKIFNKSLENVEGSEIAFDNSELNSIRKRIDNTEVVVNFEKFESEGTKQFFKLASLWLDAIQEFEKILVIDEFDIQLHPELQYYLIKMFHDPEINKTRSQLIFTTHNTKLLSTDFFRREQILFTEKKSETKSTDLYSLYDYEKRQDRSIEKAYLLGRYGGLPDLKYGKF